MLIVGKREYDALLRQLKEIRATLDAISDSMSDTAPGFRLDDMKMQEGLSNLLNFDGKLHREGEGK